VAPTETFNINIRIINQNACPSDSFTIKSVCMGHTKTLGTGTIGAAGTPAGTVDRSYPVTAQDLAGKTFTQDEYLAPCTIQVYNGAGQLTNTWPWPAAPYTIAVLVGGPPPQCTEDATKCVGTDLYTCVGGQWLLSEANSPQCSGGGGETQIPWKWIAIGAGGIVGVVLIAKGIKGG
jgi:hypothetical protein